MPQPPISIIVVVIVVDLLLLPLIVTASILVRHKRNRPIFQPTFTSPLFLETWRSGRSRQGLFCRLGGASNCLWIAVADGQLYVMPHFPFSLMFLPEILGLDVCIPVDDIRAVEQVRSFFTGRNTRVTYERPDNRTVSIDLKLRDPEAFLAAIDVSRTEPLTPDAPARPAT